MVTVPSVVQNDVIEITLGRVRDASDQAATVDVVFVDPGGRERRVPAFTSLGVDWRVRYSSGLLGRHRYFADTGEPLSDPQGEIEVVKRKEVHPLGSHGALKVADDGRRLEHADGTPFLWLADTWWHGFTRRISDEEFRTLAAQRVRQGFSVVQIVAGLYPEMAPFAPEGESESGWVWHQDFTGPNLSWFDEADQRVRDLIALGLVVCVVGAWGYYLKWMSVSQMVRHWRELIARWGAYPVVWCLAGEIPVIWYDDVVAALEAQDERTSATGGFEGWAERLLSIRATKEQLKGWNEVAREVRTLEPFGRPLTVHSIPNLPPYELVSDESLVDFWMLQTGHSGFYSLGPSVSAVIEAARDAPLKPVLVGEVCYEGIMGSSWHEMQRFLFWSHLLSGAAGHTYGAQGIWAFNTADYPAGYAGRWNDITWSDARGLPGAAHVGIGRRILAGLPWETFEPHPDWVDPHQDEEDRLLPYAAGAPNGPRVFYFPALGLARNVLALKTIRLRDLGGREWSASYINPRTAHREKEFMVIPDGDGNGTLSGGFLTPLPSMEDWVLILNPVE